MRLSPGLLAPLAALLGLLSISPPVAGAQENPVLVELFTSQGCSSCPPADALLGELAERPDVVPLSLHVDYWDYLGWKDTFAQSAFTQRQIAYRDAHGERVIYTPQMVIQGRDLIVGSSRADVSAAIDAALAAPPEATIEVIGERGMLEARLHPAGDPMEATLWFAIYSKARTVAIQRGENRGKKIAYRNVVTTLGRIGPWDGRQEMVMDVPQPEAGQGIALWLQNDGAGPVFAAARYEPPAP